MTAKDENYKSCKSMKAITGSGARKWIRACYMFMSDAKEHHTGVYR